MNNNRVDFFQKKESNVRSFSRKKRASKIWIWLIVVLLFLILGLACWKIFWAPTDLSWDVEQQDMDSSLWEQVYLQWEIKIEGNPAIFSYTIDDVNYGKIWLRSESWINLSDYAWFVELTGIVEKFWNYVISQIQSI